MTPTSYAAFLLICAVQSATPGPSTLLLVNNAIAFGWRRALVALSGDLAAIALLASLSVAGLGALLLAYPTAFLALRLVGAGYVLWLGWTYLRPAPPLPSDAPARTGAAGNLRSLWLRSFGIGFSNPKAVLFFTALFPQVLPPGSGPALLALLVATFLLVKLAILGGYALGAGRIAKRLRDPRQARIGRTLTGLFFLAFGLLLIRAALMPA
ncbi:LysE family translocator (plasmid) [Paroceanicella profunda]|uniref:LysE family translocator n=1 Tax=Paroceanicella profunda TaxID=2579971 RepID=A0A5B8FJ70_9RHOB|nr:LysE family translocator [Paroceanicella profunda]QDL94107.1 LysE family translocator [Paroceanicella profunda]